MLLSPLLLLEKHSGTGIKRTIHTRSLEVESSLMSEKRQIGNGGGADCPLSIARVRK